MGYLLRELAVCEVLISLCERSEESKKEETETPLNAPEGSQHSQFENAELLDRFLEEIHRLRQAANSNKWIDAAWLAQIRNCFDESEVKETEFLSKTPGG